MLPRNLVLAGFLKQQRSGNAVGVHGLLFLSKQQLLKVAVGSDE